MEIAVKQFSPRRAGWLLLLISGALLLPEITLHAATMEGRVRNGTTGQPAASVTVHLIKLQQGMTPVASATTDAQGVFQIETDALGGAPGLVQVDYQGATYSQPLVSPQTLAGGLNIQVYEATSDAGIVAIVEHAIFVRPSGSELAVIEQIALVNGSNPPRTYVNREGTYVFSLPGEPPDGMLASIEGTAGMPIPQTPVARSQPGSFAITYPVRPGESQVRLQYTLNYQAPFTFSKPLDQPAERTHIVIPGEGVQLSGEGLEALGKEPTTGFLAYAVAAGSGKAEFQVSGEVPADASAQSSDAAGTLLQISDPATQRVWLILTGLGLVMLAGLGYLYARDV